MAPSIRLHNGWYLSSRRGIRRSRGSSPARVPPSDDEIPARWPPAQPCQTRRYRPYRGRRPSGHLTWFFRQASTNHRIARDQLCKLRFAPTFSSRWTHRHDQVAGLGGGVPNSYLGFDRQCHAEIRQDRARLLHGTRAVGKRFVPGWRQTEHVGRISGAQRAHDHVVHLRRVLDSDQVIADVSHVWYECSNRLTCVLEQRMAKPRIAPRLGNYLRADMRADLGFIKLDDAIERGALDIPLVDEDRFERAYPQLHLRKIGAPVMIVIMFSHRRNIAKEGRVVQSEN